MSKPANKTVIGLFVVGAIALVVAGIALLGSGAFFRKTDKGVCFFDGSVGGLNVGAAVVFRGVKVGKVTDIALHYDPENVSVRIPVFIEFDTNKVDTDRDVTNRVQEYRLLIKRGLRAQLEMQSFVTGLLQVNLDFHPEKPEKLVGAPPGYLEIPTIPTPLQELAEKVQKIPIDQIISQLQSTLQGIEKVVNSPEIGKALQAVSQTAEEARGLVKNINAQINPVASQVGTTLAEVQKVLGKIDAQVPVLAAGVGDTVKDVQKLVRNVDGKIEPAAAGLDETLKEVRTLVQDVRQLAQNLDNQVKPLAAGVGETVKDVQNTVKDVQNLVRNTDGRIGQIVPGIEKTFEAAEITLRQAQSTLSAVRETTSEDSLLMVQSVQALRELSAAARSLRTLADYLERHPEAIVRGKK
jgi:paraquat-inducible protein B